MESLFLSSTDELNPGVDRGGAVLRKRFIPNTGGEEVKKVLALTFLAAVTGCWGCGAPGSEPDVPKRVAAIPAEAPEPADDRVTADQVHMRFDGVAPGSVPAGLKITETAGRGINATWMVVTDPSAPSTPGAFGTTVNENYGRTFNLALAGESALVDVEVTVKVKAVAGEEDQGGGPVWRAVDGDNYYIARWNPLEDNFRIYYVKEGNRRQIATTKRQLDPEVWHEIRITMKGRQIEGWIDGEMALTVEDDTFTKAGMVGLWIKADGLTLFDDFHALPYEG